MAQDFAKAFYKSDAWENCRAAYLSSVAGLCEECLRQGVYTPAVIVHHKIHLTPENILDPSVSLSFANLEAVCLNCHNRLHAKNPKRYRIDEWGHVISTY